MGLDAFYIPVWLTYSIELKYNGMKNEAIAES